MSDDNWRRWINSAEPMANAPEFSGDPHEGLFVAEIPCFGGGYLTIPSDSPEDPFIVECLLEAAILRAKHEKAQFQQEVTEIALAGLWISDKCIRKAGLHRHTEPTRTDNGEIRWPSAEAARSLQAAVTFSCHDIAQGLSQIGVGDIGVRKLAFTPGEIRADYPDPRSNPVRRRPLLITGDNVVVVSPTTLLIAVRDAVLESARNFGVERDVMDAYRDAVQMRVDDYADLLRWERIGGTESDITGTTVIESYYQFDCDKVAAVFTICDDLRSGSTAQEDCHWRIEPVVKGAESRAAVLQKRFFGLDKPPNEILTLIVFQGVGRPYILGLGKGRGKRTLRLVLSADELRVFTLLNLNDELALWQVARAREQLPKAMSVFGGFLDHYTLYRNRRRSYYFGDDGVPDCVFFTASAVQSRLDAQAKLDPHFVRRPMEGQYGRVFRLESRPNFPIYTVRSSTREIEFLVEGLPFPVWVVAVETPNVRLEDHRHLFFHLVDATAFWVWQCTPSFLRLVSRSQIHIEAVVIQIGLARPSEWFAGALSQTAFGITAIRDDSHSVIKLEFGPEFAAQSTRPQNVAERELARVLLQHVAGVLRVPLDATNLDAILDEHAPLGVKRRFSVAQGITQDTISTEGLPRVRRVQSFDEQIIADLLGSHLRETKGYAVGGISNDEQATLCKASVEFLYKQFRTLISQLSGAELLPQLIARQESLIADRRLLDVILATHLACFGQSNETMQECRNDMIAADRACVASRFVIESVATQPPTGSRALSMSMYDRLLAMASEIEYYGRVSDSLYYELSQHSFELLKSGRLALSAPQYEKAMADFYDAFYRRVAGSSVKEYHKAMRTTNGGPSEPPPREVVELEDVTRIEFGISLRQLGAILGAIANSPFTSYAGIGGCDAHELLSYVASDVSLDEATTASALDQFTLGARADFLRPEKPYSAADVYPWRFNRALSYLVSVVKGGFWAAMSGRGFRL